MTQETNINFMQYMRSKILLTGVAGFISSHMADELIKQGHHVVGIDNLLTGDMANVNKDVEFYEADIRDKNVKKYLKGVDIIHHFAAIARTKWTIDDPVLANDINNNGTLNLLLAARDIGIKKFVHSSSCIVYVETTPYWVTKQAGENWVKVFNDLYKLPTISLRYANVYGSLRQSEKGPAINAIASLRKSKRDDGYIWITGDGEQTRDFIHVDDVVRANIIASKQGSGEYDICTGKQTSLNYIAKQFDCPIKYVGERQGDIKALIQDPTRAKEELGFIYEKEFKDNLQIYL